MDILPFSSGTGTALFRKDDLNWGILGTARVAAKSVIPVIKTTRHNFVSAVASRDLTRAAEFARENEIPKAYGSYEELLNDVNIQVVYIPLPNSEHYQWATRAMEAGKHVLVEKPFALNADEAQMMVSAALEKSVVLMENLAYRCDPRFERAQELIRQGDLGKLRFISSSFSFTPNNPDDIRLSPELGGGALYDLGCYCVDISRLLVGREPRQVQALAYQGSSGVDLQVSASLDFGDQVYAQFTVGFNAVRQQYTRVVGTEGMLEIEQVFNPGKDNTSMMLMRKDEVRKVNFRGGDNYKRAVGHFYDVVMAKELPRFPLAESVKNMVVIDALFQSIADSGKVIIVF